eukprot:1138517-Amphidinium_carterae.1
MVLWLDDDLAKSRQKQIRCPLRAQRTGMSPHTVTISAPNSRLKVELGQESMHDDTFRFAPETH